MRRSICCRAPAIPSTTHWMTAPLGGIWARPSVSGRAALARICGKPSQQRYHPFCSARCADIDLNRWLGGHYAIPAEEAETPEGAEPEKKEDGRE